ncbi:GNAT family N-acetyltransferase [Deinococcus maricopensis]|uniref:GCN5-related N-acetyltransferase n=1 Tax=Deinococcus maricopensis (strain DSM 21211 / LMG 22137 / NRRL B-23946 / LB-34) TaxID=709986 RepID=E8UB93_DEIML|nr:GNAT family protein [Deinococcus maricopensis]ADV68332.1 GCN5-related N-acetyltransferase [Deinococcus maricopensis DSM 21211]
MQHDVTLTDGEVTLRPLVEADIPALLALAARTPDEWRHMGSAPTTEAYHRAALDAPDTFPFVVTLDGEVVGATRLAGWTAQHRGVEIGWSWLTPAQMGRGVNRRAKRLLLAYAFEGLGAARVQIKTDVRNARSQRAIEKLGAVREGVLRNHMVRADGSLRDTVMYSVTVEEWPAVRARLA